MKKSIRLIMLIICSLGFSQNKVKIDSVFHRNFYILELELYGSKKFEQDKLVFYDEYILDDGQKFYTGKYVGDAINFFEDLTKLNAPRKERAQNMGPHVDEKIFKEWKEWYTLNRKKIKWCKQHQKPYLKH